MSRANKAVPTAHPPRDQQPTPPTNANARPPRYTRTSTEWPCIFNGDFVREQVDPRIKTAWEERRSDKPKWGDLRNTFRREHCRAINPWGSETCPFAEEDCALAFLQGVLSSLKARNPHGYFIKVARSSGSYRADEGVERRARMRTDVPHPPAMGGAMPEGLREGPLPSLGQGRLGDQDHVDPVAPSSGEGVRRPVSRPQPIGELLGSLDLRPREGSPKDRRPDPETPQRGQEGTRR